MEIPPIPRSLGKIARRTMQASWLLTLWRLVLIIAFIGVIGALATAGPIGLLAAGAIFGALFINTIQQLVFDLWNARFIRV
jgi:hypothetical protein